MKAPVPGNRFRAELRADIRAWQQGLKRRPECPSSRPRRSAPTGLILYAEPGQAGPVTRAADGSGGPGGCAE